MWLRAMRTGRRSAWTEGVHHGEGSGENGGADNGSLSGVFGLGTGSLGGIIVSGGTETHNPRVRPGCRSLL